MLELHPGHIHLWFVFFDEIQDEHLLNQYRRLLTEEEQRQETRFYRARDRLRYLVTRALVRTALSRYATVAPEYWSFSKNAYGRPEIANHDETAKRLSFNISHTQSLIVLGISDGCALGVDTENISIRQAPLEIAGRFFSQNENAALCALPIDRQHHRFFQYWTLKESYIKARGMGLSIPLDQFGFDFLPDNRIAISILPALNDLASRWRFWQFQPSADYLVAVCAERSADIEQQLIMKKIVPLQSEEILDFKL